jgi:hypothetical protein
VTYPSSAPCPIVPPPRDGHGREPRR